MRPAGRIFHCQELTMEFFNFLMFDVLSEPAVLVGLIALIGLIAQKKPVTECIKGTVKTIMGFVILGPVPPW